MALKNRVKFSSTLDKELNTQLKDLSDKTRINISKLLDEAIQDLIDKHNKSIKNK